MRGGISSLTAFGTARFAAEADLREAGMIGGDEGLIVGRLEV